VIPLLGYVGKRQINIRINNKIKGSLRRKFERVNLKSTNIQCKKAVLSMNKQDKKLPEKITKSVIPPNTKAPPVDDASIRALKKGGKSA
jgi:hypothetical protein